MSSRLRGVVLLVLGCGLTALGAQTSQAEAARRFQRGVTLYKDGDFEAALLDFRGAYQLAPHFEVLYNIGLSERRLYRYGAAVKSFKAYLDQGGKKIPPSRRELVRRELTEIRELTAAVTVVVSGTGPARISLDGEEVGQSPIREPLLVRPGKHTVTAVRGEDQASVTSDWLAESEVTLTLEPKKPEEAMGRLIIDSDPTGALVAVDGTPRGEVPLVVRVPAGAHTIAAELDGHAPATMEVVLTPGQSRSVTIKLLASEADAARGPPVTGLIVSGAGLALVAGAIAFNVQAQAAGRQTTDLFSRGGTWDGGAKLVDETGRRASALSWALGLGAGLALTTGLVLILTELFAQPEPVVSLFLAPAGQGLGAVWLTNW